MDGAAGVAQTAASAAIAGAAGAAVAQIQNVQDVAKFGVQTGLNLAELGTTIIGRYIPSIPTVTIS